ncbi:MAG: saccharopine dehydrogenase NADP-binding domain-containing protein, partial [Longimicrobiales bacterium]
MKFLVLGGGAQGSAAALDLLAQDDVTHVTIADLDVENVHPALQPFGSDRLTFKRVDASKASEVVDVMTGMTGVLCG